MRLIREYGSEAEAYIAKGMLVSSGINAEVSANASASVFPAPDAGISAYSLYVPEKDFDQAVRLLESHED